MRRIKMGLDAAKIPLAAPRMQVDVQNWLPNNAPAQGLRVE
jgi:hypothetical protein